MIHLLALSLGLATMPARASDLRPLRFLVGHCWQGVLPNGDTDRHCFRAANREVRDHHSVARAGKEFYSGDTLYGWDGTKIAWTYRDADGGVMKGNVRAAADGLDFGSADYVGADGTKITIATRWIRIGGDAYEVRDVSMLAAHNRTTRYIRSDRPQG